MSRIVFATLMKNHGPDYLVEQITIEEDVTPVIDEEWRDYILNLRYDPLMAMRMKQAAVYEATANLNARLQGDYPDIRIGKFSLFADNMLGNEAAERIIRAHLEGDPRPANTVLDQEIIDANSSLYYNDGNMIAAGEILSSFEARYNERREQSQAIFGHCNGQMSEDELSQLKTSFWGYRAVTHNRLTYRELSERDLNREP